jgi:hypothetical protein
LGGAENLRIWSLAGGSRSVEEGPWDYLVPGPFLPHSLLSSCHELENIPPVIWTETTEAMSQKKPVLSSVVSVRYFVTVMQSLTHAPPKKNPKAEMTDDGIWKQRH